MGVSVVDILSQSMGLGLWRFF